MRITKQQLQQIINEEISDVLLKMNNRRIVEAETAAQRYANMPVPKGGRVNLSPDGGSTMNHPKVKFDANKNVVMFSPEQAEEVRAALRAAGLLK